MSERAYRKIRAGLQELLDGIRRGDLDATVLTVVADMHSKFTDAAIDELPDDEDRP
jgi:hypothetical protein